MHRHYAMNVLLPNNFAPPANRSPCCKRKVMELQILSVRANLNGATTTRSETQRRGFTHPAAFRDSGRRSRAPWPFRVK